MGYAFMLVILLSLLLPSTARADTVYLTDGQSVWGRSVREEPGVVIVNRPSGEVRLPKGAVGRVEPVRNTLPAHYSPPVPGGMGVPAAMPVTAPGLAGPPPTVPPAVAAPAPTGVTPAEPTALPPVPPPQ